MKLGQGVEWAIHCCALLGILPEGKSLRLEKLAEFYSLPEAYLRKHFQALSRGGVVRTVTGPTGGYRLADSTDNINLLDIYIALEGDDPCFRCTEIRCDGVVATPGKKHAMPCNIATAMYKAEKAWRDELKKVSLTKILRDAAEQIDEGQKQRTIVWMKEALGGEI